LAESAASASAAHFAQFAQFVGYEVYVRTARLGLYWPFKANRDPAAVPLPTAAQTQQIISFAVDALDLMSAPRLVKSVCFGVEAIMLSQVRKVLRPDKARISLEHRDALAAAFNRLTGSGMIEERGMEGTLENMQRKTEQAKAKAKAEKDAPGRQSCAHCGAREVHTAQFKRCSACKAAVFCCKDCQLANWPAAAQGGLQGGTQGGGGRCCRCLMAKDHTR
jgi:hypothetical protein